jgi:antitoxin (DNA-binding transcriptional repressor) of toxin-antitoxin stability system
MCFPLLTEINHVLIFTKKQTWMIKMITMNTHEAKLNFSQLITHIANGKEVLITRSGKEFAKITPIRNLTEKRIPGRDIGKASIGDDFNSPLPAELQKFFDTEE